MACLLTTDWHIGPLRGRPSGVLAKGHVVRGHAHNFDHTTLVLDGAIRVRATLPDGTTLDREFGKFAVVAILAGVEHEITALEDGTAYACLYVHRDEDGTPIERYQDFPGVERNYV